MVSSVNLKFKILFKNSKILLLFNFQKYLYIWKSFIKTIILIILGLTTSCEVDPIFEEQEHNYEFKMTGRTYQDNDGYYHLPINPTENQQSLHRFGAYVTNIDWTDYTRWIKW